MKHVFYVPDWDEMVVLGNTKPQRQYDWYWLYFNDRRFKIKLFYIGEL